MFSRDACYFFVRPKRSLLEVCVFLGRELKAPQVRRAERKSKTKVANILKITHRDQVEAPVTDWLREAYELPDALAATASAKATAVRRSFTRRRKAGPKRATSKPKPGLRKKQAKSAGKENVRRPPARTSKR